MLSHLLRWVDQNCDPNLAGGWTILAAGWGWAYLFALARVLGLVMLSPIFGHRGVSIWFRIGLAVSLAGVATPVLLAQGVTGVPSDGWAAAVHAGTEFVIGALMGVGVLAVFAGLKLAGELVDHQAGVAIQEVFDPSGAGTSTSSGQLLTVVGTLSLLCAFPEHGYLKIVAALLDSFLSTPRVPLTSAGGAVVWISHIGQESLSLAVQIAAPVLATGVVVSWGIAALGGAAGSDSISATILGIPLRVVLSLLILAVALSGMADAFLIRMEELLRAFATEFGPNWR
jgi:flagellar biosynthetic protein FliR